VTWKSKNWDVLSSRTLSNRDFPMGGFIARPNQNYAVLQIQPKSDYNTDWRVQLIFKPLKNTSNLFGLYDINNNRIKFDYVPKANIWQSVSVVAKMPLKITGQSTVELGGIWLTRHKQPGVIVSAIATNGARQAIWQKWSPIGLKNYLYQRVI